MRFLSSIVASALLGAVLLLAPSAAAQVPGGGITFQGRATPGDCPQIVSAYVQKDSGSPCGAGTNVSSFSAGTTGFTPSSPTTGAVVLSGTLIVANGGTGRATLTAHATLLGNGTGGITSVGPCSTGQVQLGSTGADPVCTNLSSSAVTSLSFGTTGLTPSSATQGAITVAGTLGFANGGTGQTSYTNGQLLIGNTATGGISKATLTAGTNVTITNGNGTITIAASGGSGTGCNTSGSAGYVLTDDGAGGCTSNSTFTYSGGSAAITGTLATSSTTSASALIPTGSSVPANGLYLPSANVPGISANSLLVANFNSVASAARNLTFTNATSSGNPTVGTSGGALNFAPSTGITTSTGARFGVIGTTDANVDFYAGSLGADLKYWRWDTAAGGMTLQALNDAYSAATSAYAITRGTTYNVAGHDFYTSSVAGTPVNRLSFSQTGDTVMVPGSGLFRTSSTLIGSAGFPSLVFSNSSAGTDLKRVKQLLGNTDGNYNIVFENDAASGSTSAYVITRGTTYNVASHTWYTSAVAGTSVQQMQLTSSGLALTTALSPGNGGTGQTSYTDGQLLIGNTTGNTLAKATITAGTGISVTNGHGTITIAATGSAASPSYQNANFTAVVGGSYCVDTTSGAVTVTMPAAPGNGDSIQFIDCLHTWATNKMTLARNSLTIMTLAEDLDVRTPNANPRTTYVSNGGVTTWFLN